jgi:hypothetical protein
MAIILFFACLLLSVVLLPIIGYRVAGQLPYPNAWRAGLYTATLEFWVLFCFSNNVVHVGPIYFRNGVQYIADWLWGSVPMRWADLLNGKRPDLLVLLLLPLLAAWLGLLVDRRRRNAARQSNQ